MKKSHVLLGIAIVVGAVVAALIGNYFGLNRETWPGWGQAIGSIAALGVAIFVMSQQNEHAAKLLVDVDKRAILRRAASVKALIEGAILQMKVCCEELPPHYQDPFRTIERILAARFTASLSIKSVRDALIAIPAHELGSYEMTKALQVIIECLSDLEVKISKGEIREIIDMGATYAITLNASRDRAMDAHAKFVAGVKSIEVD